MKRKYVVITEIYNNKTRRMEEKYFYAIAYNRMQALKTIQASIGYETIGGRLSKRTIGYDINRDASVWLYEEPKFINYSDKFYLTERGIVSD